MPAPSPRSCTVAPVRIGDILTRAWGLYTRFFTHFVAVAGAVFLGLGLVAALIEELAPSGDGGRLLAALAALIVSFVGYYWMQGVLVLMTDDVRDGRADLPIGALFARVRPALTTLVVAAILAGIGIAIGLLLLIVPGLYLLTRWSMLGPAIVLERLGAGAAFTRSHELVRGNGWPVFGLLVLMFLGNIIVGGLIGSAITAVFTGFVGNWLGTAIANTIVTPFIAIATTLVYFELGGRGAPADDGPPPEARTF